MFRGLVSFRIFIRLFRLSSYIPIFFRFRRLCIYSFTSTVHVRYTFFYSYIHVIDFVKPTTSKPLSMNHKTSVQTDSVHRRIRRSYPADDGPEQGPAGPRLREDGRAADDVPGELVQRGAGQGDPGRTLYGRFSGDRCKDRTDVQVGICTCSFFSFGLRSNNYFDL